MSWRKATTYNKFCIENLGGMPDIDRHAKKGGNGNVQFNIHFGNDDMVLLKSILRPNQDIRSGVAVVHTHPSSNDPWIGDVVRAPLVFLHSC